MSRNFTSRVLAAALLGLLLGSYIRHDYSKWRARGRQQFISFQSARYDRFVSSPTTGIATAIGALVVAFGTIGFYEVTVLLFSAVLNKTRLFPGQGEPQQPSSI